MSMIRVAVPFLQGKRRFHLTKGRAWSVVEHLILASVVESSATATRLAELSKLPRQVVIESLLRLMHAGWVQISQTREGILFNTTTQGREAANREELPSIQKPFARPMNLMIDQITGTVYRRREMPLFERHVLEKRSKQDRLVWLDPRTLDAIAQVRAIVGTLFEEDERFVSMEETGERLVERFGIAAVRDGRIEGFSSRAPDSLKDIILEAAKKAEGSPQLTSFSAPIELATEEKAVPSPLISFNNDDLVLGGGEHEDALKKAIQRCRHHLIIHSTFLLQEKFDAIKPLLMNAVQRGANVHVLWGKSDDRKTQNATRKAAARIQEELAKSSLGDAIKVHQFSTNSHAKILIADDGVPNRHFAIVGSCNWLYSGFQSFEASVRIRDPLLCADVVDQLAELSRADGHWTPLTNHFARLAFDIRREPAPSTGRAEGRLVLGHQHAGFMRMARDHAEKRIVVTSHRIGSAGRPAVLVPVMAAAERKSIDVKIYFGLPAEEGDGTRAADMTIEAKEANVRIEPIFQPKVHAKLLAWDNDFVLITSQNWLSADPSEKNVRREIGVFLRAPGAARRVIEKFQFECNAS
jgi:cardiolipin synthase A/B